MLPPTDLTESDLAMAWKIADPHELRRLIEWATKKCLLRKRVTVRNGKPVSLYTICKRADEVVKWRRSCAS